MVTNTRVILTKRPELDATPDCFEVVTEELPPLKHQEIRVAVDYISVDAGTRTMLRGEGFHQQVAVGGTILAGGVGRVIESNNPDFVQGQAVLGGLGAQTTATVTSKYIEPVDDDVPSLGAHLGMLGGSTGVTAWIGVRRVAKPGPGDIFVVSAAAGAVGSLAGQIAKLDSATVIGIAGGPDKTRFLTDALSFDAAIDYKNENVSQRLKELAPDGINIFFDNVGGDILDAALDNLAMRSRVVICGAISQYNHMDKVTGPSLYLRLAERQSTMEGFAYFHFPESIAVAKQELKNWLNDGTVMMREEILEGIGEYPNALQFMFSGKNTGKLMVKV